MPHLRATARSGVDRELHTHLAKAIKELRMACDVCARFSKDAKHQAMEIRHMASESRNIRLPPEMNDNVLRHQASKADRVARDIRQALLIIERVGHLTPPFDVMDPDLISDAMRSIQAAARKTSFDRRGSANRLHDYSELEGVE